MKEVVRVVLLNILLKASLSIRYSATVRNAKWQLVLINGSGYGCQKINSLSQKVPLRRLRGKVIPGKTSFTSFAGLAAQTCVVKRLD